MEGEEIRKGTTLRGRERRSRSCGLHRGEEFAIELFFYRGRVQRLAARVLELQRFQHSFVIRFRNGCKAISAAGDDHFLRLKETPSEWERSCGHRKPPLECDEV